MHQNKNIKKPNPQKTPPNFQIIERCILVSKAKLTKCSFKYLQRYIFRITQNHLKVPSPVLYSPPHAP